MNASEAVAEYKARLDHYETMIRQCTSAAKCEEKTSYFTMSVLPSNGEDWVKYEATNSPKKGKLTQKVMTIELLLTSQVFGYVIRMGKLLQNVLLRMKKYSININQTNIVLH